MPTEMLSIRIPEETAVQVRQLAEARRISVSDLLRAALDGLLTGQHPALPIDPHEVRITALEQTVAGLVARLDSLGEMARHTVYDNEVTDSDDVSDNGTGEKAPGGIRDRILAHLAQVASASPADIAKAIEAKTNSVTAELTRMKQAGKVEGERGLYRLVR